MSSRILVIDEEPAMVSTLACLLGAEGHAVESACDGREGLARAATEPFDLVILDVMLPGKSGFEVCRELRRRGRDCAILMLTARSQLIDRVVGLKLGADDYMTDPFDPPELLARVEALLRRVHRQKFGPVARFRFGDVEVDFDRGELRRDGRPVDLTPLEFKLLGLFIRSRGRVLSRERLVAGAWGPDTFTSERIVDNHIASLRRKIEPDPANPRYLRNLRGLGYRFDG